jgi:hypothetical protein
MLHLKYIPALINKNKYSQIPKTVYLGRLSKVLSTFTGASVLFGTELETDKSEVQLLVKKSEVEVKKLSKEQN